MISRAFSNVTAFITDEASQEPREFVALAREFGLKGVELRSVFGRAFKDLTDADVRELRHILQGEGLKVHGCATPVFKCALDDTAVVAEHRELFKRSLEIAARLDCRLLRVFTFLRSPAGQPPASPARIATQLLALGELAAAAHVTIGVENELSCQVATVAESRTLLALLPATRFGLIWDPCNILYLPEQPLPVTAGFADLVPRIAHVHVKDAARRLFAPAGTPPLAMPVGLGDVNWRQHLGELRAAGYADLLSLETHWRVQELAQEMLHLPAGHKFSQGGLEATRVCLRNLEALLATGS